MQRYLANLALALACLALLSLQGCSNPQKMIYKGQYDAVVVKISDKFKKSLKRKPENCSYLEDAFRRANAADLAAVEQLKAENNDANWNRIGDLYKKIEARQNRISPLLPLKDDNGKTYEFNIVSTTQARVESQQKASEFHYNRGTTFLTEARQRTPGTYHLRAREAFAEFDEVRKINSNYKDNATLLREAQELGTINILATYSDNTNSGQIYNKNAMMDSLFYNYRGDTWTKLDYSARPNIQYNYDLIVIANKLHASDIATKDNSQARSTNVDTTINNQRQSVAVNANIIIRSQRQTLRFEGVWQVIDKNTGALVCNQNIMRSLNYEHKSATYTGDVRALTAEDVATTKNSPTFPSREKVLLLLGTATREEIYNTCTWRKP